MSTNEASIPPPINNVDKIRLLVITMGGPRQALIEKMFASSPTLSSEFDLTFSPGVPSRSIRARVPLYEMALKCGLLDEMPDVPPPPQKAAVIAAAALAADDQAPAANSTPQQDFADDLWRRAKSLSRDRSVLACTFAHLIAITKHCDELKKTGRGYDLIMEDNCRVLICLAPRSDEEKEEEGGSVAAHTIREAIRLSKLQSLDEKSKSNDDLGMILFGYLGPIDSVKWTHETYIPNHSQREKEEEVKLVPFPFNDDLDVDDDDDGGGSEDKTTTSGIKGKMDNINLISTTKKPKIVTLWGAYAYSVTPRGLDAVLTRLRSDLTALLWKSKAMKVHKAKPIDRILPRRIADKGLKVFICSRPVFFRAPMLESKIHAKWDAEFCKSTTVQLDGIGYKWSDMWLSPDEQSSVTRFQSKGVWEPAWSDDLEAIEAAEAAKALKDAVWNKE
jgi:hypothetical protein